MEFLLECTKVKKSVYEMIHTRNFVQSVRHSDQTVKHHRLCKNGVIGPDVNKCLCKIMQRFSWLIR